MARSNSHRKVSPPHDYIDALRGRLPTATDQEKARLHAEIAERYERRYAWDVEQRCRPATSTPHLILQVRLRELERLFAKRYGDTLPNDDAGWGDLVIAAHTIAGLGGEIETHIVAWASIWAPWLATARAEQLAAHVKANPLKFKADTLGWRLGLTVMERAALDITTIGAVGVNKEQRAAERKEKQAAAARVRRAKQSSGKPVGRPKKIPLSAGNRIEDIGGDGISTSVAKRGTGADGLDRGEAGRPVAAHQPLPSQPKVILSSRCKPTQAVTVWRPPATNGRSKPQAPCAIRMDWAPPAKYGLAFDPESPPDWVLPLRAFANAIASRRAA
jgi:hypothetical protein